MATVRNPDRWGYGIGTQASYLNHMLAGEAFLNIDEMYQSLVRQFGTTTRSRVSSHMASLRIKQRAHLEERRKGRTVMFRLLVQVPEVGVPHLACNVDALPAD